MRYYTEQMCKSVKRRSRVAGWSPSKAAAVVEQIQARQAAAAEKQEPPPVPEATSMLLLLGQYGVKVAASLSFSHVHMLGCVTRDLGNVVNRADPTTPVFSLAGAAVCALLFICALSCLLAALWMGFAAGVMYVIGCGAWSIVPSSSSVHNATSSAFPTAMVYMRGAEK